MKKILLVHGVLHTTKVFDSLIESLSGVCSCRTFSIPGLDDNKDASYENQVELLRMHLNHNSYNLIVAHSYGAYLVLSALDFNNDCKVLLLNPLYSNFQYWLNKSLFMLKFLPVLKSFKNSYLCKKFLYKVAELTCNDKTKINDTLIEGVFVCNAKLYKLLKSISYEVRPLRKPRLYMIWGCEDRLLGYPYTISRMCKEVISIECGHSSFIEREDIVVCKIKELIGVQ